MRLFKKGRHGGHALPQLLSPVDYRPLFPDGEFFPRPDWERIYEKLESDYSQSLDQAWKDLAFIWLSLLAEKLGETYGVFTSKEFIILSPPKRAQLLLETLESQRKRILNIIDDGEREEGLGLYTVLVFADIESYLPYISAFGPEGEEAMSGGIFIGDSYGHMVVHGEAMWQLEPVLAHELTHYLLWPSALPAWVEEGVCMTVEQLVSSVEGLRMDRKRAQEHRDFWSSYRLRRFWNGEAFFCPRAQEYAYELAQVMVRLLAETHGSFPAYLRIASREDAGFQAARDQWGIELTQVAAGFLGPGDWL